MAYDKNFKASVVDVMFDNWSVQKFGPIGIVSRQLNQDKAKPSLFVITGVSERSFQNSAKIVVSAQELLSRKYNSIYIVSWSYNGDTTVRDAQVKSCQARDEIKSDERMEKFEPEIDFMTRAAMGLNHIITSELKLSNVHLLGKCAGGGIAIQLLPMNPIYTGLLLAVPSSPTNILSLLEMKGKLRRIMFRFAWNVDDEYMFPWGNISRDERSDYDDMIRRMEIQYGQIDCISRYYDKGFGHEIHPDFLCDLALQS